jgi:putative transposase
MSRHTTFRFCLDPAVEQCEVLARHAGAARFAFNQCLRIVKTALTDHKRDPTVDVPWTAFDLINTFNAWKKTEDAGRVFAVEAEGTVEAVVTGLAWRGQVCQQVFEEAAVDLGKGLAAWSDSRSGKRKGPRIGFPRFKRKTGAVPSFRLRNKNRKDKPPAIRVGEHDRPRSITLPGIGQIGVHDDTRRHFLHQVSNALVKTHDRLVIEDLNVLGMLANHRLARAISDAGWAEFARLLK